MHFTTSSKILRSALLALAFLVTASRASTVLPPHHPDSTHVFNGCRLSSLAYLAKFTAEFPSERGQTMVLRVRNAGNSPQAHTIALITWQGEWWVRDEYYGVFPLKSPVTSSPDFARLTATATSTLEREAKAAMRRANAPRPPMVPATLSTEERLRDVRNATTVIPVPSTIYWVRDGKREIPVAFFRPAPGQIALYDPSSGTGSAECASTDDAGIVALVARQFGYRAESVRPDFAPLTGTLVATVASTSHASAQ